jgi:L-tyrosine C(3)-methyltransferase
MLPISGDLGTLSHETLMLIAFGHAAFQYLNAGCSLGVFSALRSNPGLTRNELADRCGLSHQSARRMMFGMASLGLIEEHGAGFRNAASIEHLFEIGDWNVFADLVKFHGNIVYAGEMDFVQSLKAGSNIGLRRIPGNGPTLYHRLAKDPFLQGVFYQYMHSWSAHAVPLLTRSFDFSQYRRLADMCGGDGINAIALATAFPSLERVTLVDLPGNSGLARDNIDAAGLADRIRVMDADILSDEFPREHDCFVYIHALVIWSISVVTNVLKKTFDALPQGGAVVIFSSISSDDGKGPLMAALDTAYFVSIPAEGGMIHSWGDYENCLSLAGFSRIRRIPCQSWTPHGVMVGIK